MEIWKDVIGYEELYQVSNLGKVKALAKVKSANTGYYITKEIILKARLLKMRMQLNDELFL